MVLAGISNAVSAAVMPDQKPVTTRTQSEIDQPTMYRVSVQWKTVTFKMGPSIKYWKKVAQCETGGNWQNKGRFAGGLGIADTTWKAFGGRDFAVHPSQATMFEQIVVANRIAVFGFQTKKEYITLQDRLDNKPYFRPPSGFNGWGCIKHNHYLRPPNNNTYKVQLPVGDQYYCPQYEGLFEKYALPPKVFSYIAWRESRCIPTALNTTLNADGTRDSGLLQINSSWHNVVKQEIHHAYSEMSKPEVNVMFASWILHFTSNRLKNWNIKAKL